MFCFHCGNGTPDAARFCSKCGANLAGSASPSSASPSSPPPTSPPPASIYTQSSQSSPGSNALLSGAGYPQPPFERLAAAIFNALDQNIAPQRTGGLEVVKMGTFRTMGGLTIPPYYAEYVLPTYADIVGIELVPGQAAGNPVVTWNGWHQYLLQKIKAEPEQTYLQITRVVAAFQISIPLSRSDFPLLPFPDAQSKESLFKTRIYSMARVGLQSPTVGLGGFGLTGGGHGAHKHKHSLSHTMLKLAAKGGMDLLNNSLGGSNNNVWPGNY